MAGVSLCRSGECSWSHWQETAWRRSGDQKPAHFHLDHEESWFITGIDWNTVQLYAVEDVLWELPAKGLRVDGMGNNIIFVNDPGLRVASPLQVFGPSSAYSQGIRLPTWQRYVEALILLALSSSSDGYAYRFWFRELLQVADLGDPDQLGHPAFTKFVKGLTLGPQTTVGAEIAEARKSLGSRLRTCREN